MQCIMQDGQMEAQSYPSCQSIHHILISVYNDLIIYYNIIMSMPLKPSPNLDVISIYRMKIH